MILQTNPKAGYLAHKNEIDDAIHRTLDSGWYILGQEVDSFEKEFSSFLGANYAIGAGNGTDALDLALRACGVGIGDSVITVSHTATATAAAIERSGAAPVFVDIDLQTYVMDPEHLEKTVQSLANRSSCKFKAIIPVHLYGHPADMPAILEISKKYGLFVIEDCAQSHGAVLQDRMTGTWGDLAAFSFYPTKNLGALGDGGAVAVNDAELAARVRSLREYGWKQKFVSEESGMNSRLDELQAAILRVKLKHLRAANERRNAIAEYYNQRLADSRCLLPAMQPNAVHVYHQYVIQVDRRDELKNYLQEKGIGTAIHYPLPVHLQPAYQKRYPMALPLNHTESIASKILSLPMYPELTDDELHYITETILSWLSR
ncbi:MAG: DegT/DnrJ/EryC1/StrS family aminotransferase [Candidatus Omnitrophota bacterium]